MHKEFKARDHRWRGSDPVQRGDPAQRGAGAQVDVALDVAVCLFDSISRARPVGPLHRRHQFVGEHS